MSKRNELNLMLKRYNVHIALLSETFLKAQNKFQVPNYDIIRKDDNNHHGGGIAILVHKSIKYQQINIPLTSSLPEILGIKIFTTSKPITFLSVYIPNNIKNILRSDLNSLLRIDDRVLIAGDFNARHHKWLCNSNNSRGKSLYNFVNENNHRVDLHYPMEHTYHPNDINKSSSTIDLALSKNLCIPDFPKSLQITDSDHNPVLLQINMIDYSTVSNNKTFYNYKSADWLGYKRYINENIEHNVLINNPDEIDDHITKLTQIMNDAIEYAVPKRIPPSQCLPINILQDIQYKNSVRKVWQNQKRKSIVIPGLKTYLNYLSNCIKDAIFKYRNIEWRNKLKSYRAYDSNIFQLIKNVTRKNEPPQPLIKDNSVLYNPVDKANFIAETYEAIHKQNENLGDVKFTELVKETTTNYLLQHEALQQIVPTTPDEIWNLTKKLKANKAPGNDKISNISLKYLPKKGRILFTKIINAILKTGYFPTQWKLSKVLPFPKPGKVPNKPENMRPISLLSKLSKLTEKIILLRLKSEVDEKNILQDEQFGFRSKHSTTHALINIITDLTNSLNDKNCSSMVLLDVEKAFDTVWQDGLIYKLIKSNISSYLVKVIHSYLDKRRMSVHINEFSSNEKPIAAGVPQGSILGPLLFIFYISDMPKSPHTNMSIFADDTAIYSSQLNLKESTTKLQEHLMILENYFHQWKIKINANKSEHIDFTRKRRIKPDEHPIQLKYDNNNIQMVDSAKYLGVTLQRNLKFSLHVNNTILKAKKAMSILFPFIRYENEFNTENKLLMYKLFIRPILTYSIQCWNNISKSKLKSIQIIQNKNLRMALDLRPDKITYKQVKTDIVHEMANVLSIEDFALKLIKNTYLNMINHENNIIANLTVISDDSQKIFKTPFNILNGLLA